MGRKTRAALLTLTLAAGSASFGAPVTEIGKIDRNMAVKTTVSEGIRWYDPAEAPFRLGGLNWFRENRLYRRLPVRSDLPKGPAALAHCTTGVTLGFRTNSRRIQLDVRETVRFSGLPHMPATGRSGFDLYVGGPGKWRIAGVSIFKPKSDRVELFADKGKPAMREFLLNFPLYNGVEEIRIGLDENAEVLPPTPYASPKRIVAYGGSVMQGACASRPGRAFMNIIGRHFNLEVVNLGFSGSSYFEPVMGELTAAVERPAVVILEGDRNAGWKRIRELEPAFIETIRKKHPGVPIVVMNGNPWWGERDLARERNLAEQRAFFERMSQSDPDLIFWDCVDFIGPDHGECLVDGKHPSDLGFYRMSEHMIRLLTPILKKYKVIE